MCLIFPNDIYIGYRKHTYPERDSCGGVARIIERPQRKNKEKKNSKKGITHNRSRALHHVFMVSDIAKIRCCDRVGIKATGSGRDEGQPLCHDRFLIVLDMSLMLHFTKKEFFFYSFIFLSFVIWLNVEFNYFKFVNTLKYLSAININTFICKVWWILCKYIFINFYYYLVLIKKTYLLIESSV